MKGLAIGIVTLVIVGVGGFFIWRSMNKEEPAAQTTPTTTPTTAEPEPSEPTQKVALTVTYTNSGFSPAIPEPIKVGDTVKFVNNSSASMWVASDDHPSHTKYPEFDALSGVGPGESYEFTFEKAGTWGYHNHLRPEHEGTIIVKSN